ncbi:alpha/beta hydrolase fold domain-containing protein [Cellulomonas sp. NPDC055163]
MTGGSADGGAAEGGAAGGGAAAATGGVAGVTGGSADGAVAEGGAAGGGAAPAGSVQAGWQATAAADARGPVDLSGYAVPTFGRNLLPPHVAGVVPGARSRLDVAYSLIRGVRPLLLDLHVPAGDVPPTGWPCVVWVHGGGWEEGHRRSTPEGWPERWLFAALVGAGLAVSTVDYRLSGEARFPGPLDDVSAAVRHLRLHAVPLGLDADRFALAGESAGGHLAGAAALAGYGSIGGRVQALVLLYTPTDLVAQVASKGLTPEQEADTPEARLLGGRPADLADDETSQRASLHLFAGSWGAPQPPVLLVTGDADRTVPPALSRRLRDDLVAAGAPDVTLDVVPGADHCLVGVDPVPVLERVVAFLADRLRPEVAARTPRHVPAFEQPADDED